MHTPRAHTYTKKSTWQTGHCQEGYRFKASMECTHSEIISQKGKEKKKKGGVLVKKIKEWPGMVMQAFQPNTWEAKRTRSLWFFEASTIWIVSSRAAKATVPQLVSKQNEGRKQNSKFMATKKEKRVCQGNPDPKLTTQSSSSAPRQGSSEQCWWGNPVNGWNSSTLSAGIRTEGKNPEGKPKKKSHRR